VSTATGVSTALAQAITHYGYFALAAAVLAENLGLPVPGETAVLLAAAASAAGQLNVVVVWLVAVCAAIIGDNIGFGLGHFGGKPFFVRFGPRIGVGPENYAMTERFFDRYGGPAVMVARFIPVIRVIAAIAAGASGMHWKCFLPWQAIGACLWATFAVVGGFFGNRALGIIKPMLIEEFGKWWPFVMVTALVLGFATVSLVSHLLARRLTRPE
jgi:membrane protein DedA with SNARE-associated domain